MECDSESWCISLDFYENHILMWWKLKREHHILTSMSNEAKPKYTLIPMKCGWEQRRNSNVIIIENSAERHSLHFNLLYENCESHMNECDLPETWRVIVIKDFCKDQRLTILCWILISRHNFFFQWVIPARNRPFISLKWGFYRIHQHTQTKQKSHCWGAQF